MKKRAVYFVIFLLAISLVSAVSPSMTINGNEFSGNASVVITVNGCAGTSIMEIINPSDTLVDLKSDQDNYVAYYNTQSDSADGKYKIKLTCTNGEAEKYFCVDSPGCLSAAVTPTSTTGTTPSTTPSGGGGGVCASDWKCSTWSFCGANLKQTRTCTDNNYCLPNKIETQDCLQCEESWICSLWSECYSGMNERNCYDEHGCGTTFNKPLLKKSCKVLDASGPPPKQVSAQLPPPTYYQPPAAAVSGKSTLEKLWENYGFYAAAGVVGVILIIVIIVLLIKLFKPRRKAFNLNELIGWAKKERAMGTSVEDVKEILEKHTGWRENEIRMVMRELERGEISKYQQPG